MSKVELKANEFKICLNLRKKRFDEEPLNLKIFTDEFFRILKDGTGVCRYAFTWWENAYVRSPEEKGYLYLYLKTEFDVVGLSVKDSAVKALENPQLSERVSIVKVSRRRENDGTW